jgi:hypothetical protein
LFVITGQVGARRFHGMEMSTWEQIREMVESGLATVGSHTHNMHEPGRSGLASVRRSGRRHRVWRRSSNFDCGRSSESSVRHLIFRLPVRFGTPQTDEATLRLGMHLVFSLREGLARPSDPSFFIKRLMITRRNAALIDRWGEPREPQP